MVDIKWWGCNVFLWFRNNSFSRSLFAVEDWQKGGFSVHVLDENKFLITIYLKYFFHPHSFKLLTCTILVGTQVRIGLSFASRKKRLNWGSHTDETAKTEALYHNRCGTIKIPPCSIWLTFSTLSPVLLTSSFYCKEI